MLLERRSLWQHSRVLMSSSKQSMIWKVSGLSTKTNLQSCCCFTSFLRGAKRTSRSGSLLACTAPSLSPCSGNFSGVGGAGRPSWLRTGGVTGADTGAFAALSAGLKSRPPQSTELCTVVFGAFLFAFWSTCPDHDRIPQHACCPARTPSRASLR